MKLFNKEAFAKAMFWRFAISVPLGTLITFLFIGQVFQVIALVITMNVIMTIAHYFFETSWPWLWEKMKGKQCRGFTDGTQPSTTNTSISER